MHGELYRYLTTDRSDDYVAIMSAVTSDLLSELTVPQIAERLANLGRALDPDTVADRCEELAKLGNLVSAEGGETTAAGTVTDFARARTRYRASYLGARVHRGVAASMAGPARVREVSRELLPRMLDALNRLADPATSSAEVTSPEVTAALVTGLFRDHADFTESVGDFYTHLADEPGDGPELLDYVDVVGSDLNRYAPEIDRALADVRTRRPNILIALADLDTLAALEPGPGRTHGDWDRIEAFWDERNPRSGPAVLRAAATRALRRLFAGQIAASPNTDSGVSPRADLLRLAQWLDQSSNEGADRLFAAAVGASPSRHLMLGPDEPDPRVSAATSWWTADPITVPLSLRERGDRVSRGRVARVPDPAADRERVEAVARNEAEAADAAARELLSRDTLSEATLSPAARALLLTQLARLVVASDDSGEDAQWADPDLNLRLTAQQGADTVILSSDGTLRIHGLMISARSLDGAER